MIRWSAILLCVVLGAGLSASAADDASDRAAITATLNLMAKAYVSKDIKTLQAIYHDDITYGHTDGHFETKAEVLEVVRTRHTQAFELSPQDIRIIGSTATYRGTETLKFMNGERLVTSTRGVIWVFIRGKGPHGWQVVARQNWPIPTAKPS